MSRSARSRSESRTVERSTLERNLSLLLIVCAAVILAVLAAPALMGKVYTYDDLSKSNLPMRVPYWNALHAGDGVLWARQFHCGVYLHGESEVGMFHPFHYLLYRTLPLATAYSTEFVTSYLWLFFGTFVLLRFWRFERSAALFGAMVFSFGGFNLMHFMHIAPMAVIAHIPWLLYANEVLLCSNDARHRLWAQLAIPVLTASQCLLGHPQFVLFSFMAESSFALMRARSCASWRRPVALVVAKILGGAIGAVQLIPLWEFVAATSRSAPTLAFRVSFSMHPWNLVQLWSPFALAERYYADVRWNAGNTHEMGLYAGAFCTVMLPWLAIRGRKLESRRIPIKGLLILAIVSLVLALGKYAGLYTLLVQLPGIRSLAFRAPTRFILLLHLALSVLAAYALSDLATLDKARGPTLRRSWPLLIPLALSLATLIGVAVLRSQPGHPAIESLGSIGGTLVGLALVSAAVVLVALAARGVRLAVYGIVLLTFVEIAVFGLWQHIVQRGPPRTIEQIVATLDRPPTREGRLFHEKPTSEYALDGYDMMTGNVGLLPAKQLRADLLGLQLANVHWALLPEGWRAVPDPLPRFRMVAGAVASDNVAVSVRTIDVATTAIVDRPVDLRPGPPGRVEVLEDRPGALRLRTTSPTRQLLVVSESYHPGWKARIDGAEAPVLRAYGDFMGLVVDPGTKDVVLRFEPASFSWGLRISVIGSVLTLLGLAVSGRMFRGQAPARLEQRT